MQSGESSYGLDTKKVKTIDYHHPLSLSCTGA